MNLSSHYYIASFIVGKWFKYFIGLSYVTNKMTWCKRGSSSTLLDAYPIFTSSNLDERSNIYSFHILHNYENLPAWDSMQIR